VAHRARLDTRHVNNLPGRETDVSDAGLLAQLGAHGLVRGSSVPPEPIRRLRELTRTRTGLIRRQAEEIQRLEKLLEDAAIKLSAVATDITGVSGRAMLEALSVGQRDPAVLAELAKRVDRQIKRRGVRIEPGEIEEAVRRDPHVGDVVVVPEGDTAEGRVPVAYLTPDGAAASSALAAEVRERLRVVVPEHLVPDRWVVGDAFPLKRERQVRSDDVGGPRAGRLRPRHGQPT
jgi:acyl-CoA synthetase (AMP-forming)/AMP-acid ligase II